MRQGRLRRTVSSRWKRESRGRHPIGASDDRYRDTGTLGGRSRRSGSSRSRRLVAALQRSEEHTSELQSLMRISYAVFCLKKKQRKPTHTIYIIIIKLTNTSHTILNKK